MEKYNTYIGVYGGSFDPPHLGHMTVLRDTLAARPEIKEIWVMVSPGNPQKQTQTPFKDRYQMVSDILEALDDPRLIPCDLESLLPGPPWYTSETLKYLRETWPSQRFALIVGEDCINSFRTWRNWNEILQNHRIYVHNRPGCGIPDPEDWIASKLGDIVPVTGSPCSMSSSQIRQDYLTYKDYLHPRTFQYIDAHNLYPAIPF